MEDNPNPTPNPTPAPAAPEPTVPEQPAPAPESQPAEAPAPERPEPTPAPEPAPAPEQPEQPESAPAPEPTPAPEQPEQPEPAPSPERPTPTSTPEANPAAPAAEPTKKKNGGLIAAIIAGAVILLGGLGFLLFSIFSKNPTNLANEAFLNALNAKTFAYKATAEASSDSDDVAYSTEVISLENGDTFFRLDGVGKLFGASFSAFGIESDAIETIFKKVENVWWKVEAGSDTDSDSMSMAINPDALKLEERQKATANLKANPFLVAEKVADRKFATSGDVYKITIDQEKYSAYKKANGDDNDDSAISGFSFDKSDATIYFTIQSPLFGSATLTGLYIEEVNDSSTGKMSIDFEHCQKTAPTDFKDSSEMSKLVEEGMKKLYIYNSGDYGTDDDYDDSEAEVTYDETSDLDFDDLEDVTDSLDD